MYEGLRELHLGVGAKWGIGPTQRWGSTYGRARGGVGCPGNGLPRVERFVARFEAGLGLLEEGHEGSATLFCAEEGREGKIRGDGGEVGSPSPRVPRALLENVGNRLEFGAALRAVGGFAGVETGGERRNLRHKSSRVL